MAETVTGRLTWDDTGKKLYETGTDRGVLYLNVNGAYPNGVPWNGLTGVTESPSGAEATSLYANNGKYINLYSAEEFGATITSYTYPDEFAKCDGSVEIVDGVSIGQQTRATFGFSYRTLVGNDTQGQSHGYKIHAVYGAVASPSEKAYATVNDSPEAVEFSYEVTTTPVNVTGNSPTSTLVIDSTKVSAKALAAVEDVLYGIDAKLLEFEPDDWTEGYANYGKMQDGVYTPLSSTESFQTGTFYSAPVAARLPLPDEMISIISAADSE